MCITLEEVNHTFAAQLSLLTAICVQRLQVGQFVSSRADVMPEAYIKVLRKCEDGLPPRPKKETKATLRSQLGDIDEIFSSFDWQPIACASIAQVHVAHLRSTGEKVAVKVQHKYARVRAEQVCDYHLKSVTLAMYML